MPESSLNDEFFAPKNQGGVILVVDDDKTNRKLFRDILKAHHYEVCEAENGKAAIEALQVSLPDLVLMDAMMPIMDGFECTKEIKNTPHCAHLPVIMVTSLDDRQSILKGLDAGAEEFISKPVDYMEVLTRIRNLLRLKRMHDFLRRNYHFLRDFNPVSSLPNRSLLKTEFEHRTTHKETPELTLILSKIDQLKSISDSLGQDALHAILREFARRLTEFSDKQFFLAHPDTEVFAILVKGTKDIAISAAKSMQLMVEQPFVYGSQKLCLTVSQGIACYPEDSKNFDSLYSCCKQARLFCEHDRSTPYCSYTPDMTEQTGEHLRLISELRQAIAKNEFRLYYQPQINVKSKCVYGVEALIRWQHPRLGLLSPARFLHIAEQEGLLPELGNWVLTTACKQLKEWQQKNLPPLIMSVNVSAVEFAQEQFSAKVAMLLEELKLQPGYLELELTETMLLESKENSLSALREIKAMGVRLALDDFGTGYSSLQYLSRLPVDRIKIDRCFIEDVTNNPNNAKIVKSIIAMALKLNREVVAEGIESEAQLTFLWRNHCHLIQGYYFSKPLTPEELVSWTHLTLVFPETMISSRKKNRSMLIVDDEHAIRSALKRLFRQDDIQLFMASSGEEGLEILAKNNIQIILSDERMPGMKGTEFLRLAKELYPESIRIVLSGYTDLKTILEAINEGAIYKFISKPWEDDHLKKTIFEAFRTHEMSSEVVQLRSQLKLNHGR